MSRPNWAITVGTYDGARMNTAGAQPVQSAANASTVRMFAGDTNSTGDRRIVAAAPAPAAPAEPERSADAGEHRQRAKRTHTLELIGELDRSSAPVLEREIERLCEAGVAGVTIDLRRLTSIDSAGVSVLAFRSALCRRRGIDFALIPGPPAVQRAFALAGVLESLSFRRPGGGSSARDF